MTAKHEQELESTKSLMLDQQLVIQGLRKSDAGLRQQIRALDEQLSVLNKKLARMTTERDVATAISEERGRLLAGRSVSTSTRELRGG